MSAHPMDGPDPMDRPTRLEMVPYLPNGTRRCQARSKQSGVQCGNPVTPGATTCRFHGSRAPQVQRAARLKLLDLIDPAIATLAREMTNSNARPADRIRAAEAILDRTGHPRQVQVTGDDARELLRQRIFQLVSEAAGEQDAVVDQARQIIAGQTEGVADDHHNDDQHDDDHDDDGEAP